MVNLLGFIPLGFILCGFVHAVAKMTRRDRLILAVASCAILSLVIEISQAYIPGRVSSLMDVVLNVLGAALGGGLRNLVEASVC